MPTKTQKNPPQAKQSKQGARQNAASAGKRTGRDSGGDSQAATDARNGREKAARETLGKAERKLSPEKPVSDQTPEEAIARKRARQVATDEEPESGSVQR